MVARIDITGKVYTRLKVKGYSHFAKNKSYWTCECECGTIKVISKCDLRSGKTQSCGCLHKEKHTTHGNVGSNKKTPTYCSWQTMKQRCNNPKDPNFHHYGGRGIKIHEEWIDFSVFLRDMGERPSLKFSLDRIDTNGNYEPNNCKWSTMSDQIFNRRSHKRNSLGEVGIRKTKNGKRYQARITHNRKDISLGTFDTLEEAKKARQEAELKYYGRTLEN